MKPLARRELIRRFRALGFDGPISGGRHAFMQRTKLKIRIPGEHRRDVSVALQREILRQASIAVEDWERA